MISGAPGSAPGLLELNNVSPVLISYLMDLVRRQYKIISHPEP